MKVYLKIFVVLSAIVINGCAGKTETTYPEKKDITESVYAAGFIKSKNQYEVFAKLNGKIETVFVKEGDTIQQGSALFQLENNSTKLSTENARAAAFANDYQRNKAKLMEAENAIELAQKKVENDSVLLVRQQALWRQNIGSKIQLEQQELNFENAKSNLEKARVAYEDLKRQLQLAAEQSQNNLKIAQATESDLLIRSELDGIVYKINATKGELTNGMSPLAILGEDQFLIEFNVDEQDIVKIKKGNKVIVRLDSYPNQVFEAEVSFIYPLMDPRKRSFLVEATFKEAPQVLYPNLSLEANIIINEKKDVLTIHSRYLINDSEVMLDDGSIRTIKVGLKDYNTVEVLSGLDEHTRIQLPKN
jgi:multidrug efflux pump subunit AcrA (membrane-fusion protein)